MDDDSPTSSFSGDSPGNSQLPPRKRFRTFTRADDNNDTNHIIPSDQSSPPKGPKRHEFAVPKDVTEGSAGRTITAWRKLHEINLLNHILGYYKQNGTYPFDDSTHSQKFYERWIENEAYVDEHVFNNKMVELPERFFKNQDKSFVLGAKLKAWMPPADVRIYELSNMIWGNDNDDNDNDNDDDGDDDNVVDDGSILNDQEENK